MPNDYHRVIRLCLDRLEGHWRATDYSQKKLPLDHSTSDYADYACPSQIFESLGTIAFQAIPD